jgi:arsenite methyltransferase
MANKKPFSAELEPSYFQLQAYWGATKHAGGLHATAELITLCHITKHQHILDIGCGAGTTATHLAKTHHTTVTALDVNPKMVQWTKERAKREDVADKVNLIIADAQHLPLQDAHFDAVIGESITAFLQEKQRGLSEYVRVTKPEGYVGLNEMIWTNTPAPTELVEYYYRTTGAKPETSDGWRALLESSGLGNIVVRTYRLSLVSDVINRIRRLGSEDFSRALSRFLSLYITSPAFRRYAKETQPPLRITKEILEYLGYGLYVGRKQKR